MFRESFKVSDFMDFLYNVALAWTKFPYNSIQKHGVRLTLLQKF